MKVKTICENRLLCYLGADNAPFTTTLSNPPMFTVWVVKTGHLYSELPVEKVKTERRIQRSWFRASQHSTTMGALTAEHNRRPAPLREGERELGWCVLPPFQRPPVWTTEQKVRFIESAWLGLPIGVYIINRAEYDSPFDNWLLDGQQRVTAVLEYMADAFPVLGYHYGELTDVDHRGWEIGTVFGRLETNLEDEAQLRDVYDRLAYGGTPHAPKDRAASVDTLPEGPRHEVGSVRKQG
jgi:hypothetical protein